MTAGHNALHGSGPGQKLAFDNALALVGCPDRRIEALHYVLFALPTVTSRRMPGAILFKPQARLVLCNVQPLAIIAHAILTILLASAIAATFVGRRASNAVSQADAYCHGFWHSYRVSHLLLVSSRARGRPGRVSYLVCVSPRARRSRARRRIRAEHWTGRRGFLFGEFFLI